MERREFAIQILAFFFCVSKNVTEFICARKYLFPWDMHNGYFFLQFLTIISYKTKAKVRKWRNCITTLFLSWFQNFADFLHLKSHSNRRDFRKLSSNFSSRSFLKSNGFMIFAFFEEKPFNNLELKGHICIFNDVGFFK